jgi:hypothetical protein
MSRRRRGGGYRSGHSRSGGYSSRSGYAGRSGGYAGRSRSGGYGRRRGFISGGAGRGTRDAGWSGGYGTGRGHGPASRPGPRYRAGHELVPHQGAPATRWRAPWQSAPAPDAQNWPGPVDGRGASPEWDGMPRRRGNSVVARAPEIAGVWAWRHRWQLTPVAATVGAGLVVPLAPVVAGVGGGAAAAGLYRLARWGKPVAGRMWLSAIERRTAATWCAAVGTWSLWSALPVPGAGSWWILAAGAAVPSWKW